MTTRAAPRSTRGFRRLDSFAGFAWLCLFALGTTLGLAACDASPRASAPRFRAVSLQAGDGITFDDSTDDVIIKITSERGIGSAEIERLGRPPKTLTVNLQLKGLENLELAWGDARVSAHVNSGSGEVREELSLKGTQAVSIASASPYWMPVRIEAANPQIPLQNGSFAVAAPPAFLQASPDRFSLRWIDFYR